MSAEKIRLELDVYKPPVSMGTARKVPFPRRLINLGVGLFAIIVGLRFLLYSGLNMFGAAWGFYSVSKLGDALAVTKALGHALIYIFLFLWNIYMIERGIRLASSTDWVLYSRPDRHYLLDSTYVWHVFLGTLLMGMFVLLNL